MSAPGVFLRLALLPADVFLLGEDSGSHQGYFLGVLQRLGMRASFWNIALSGPAPLVRGAEFARKAVIYDASGRTSPLRQSEDSNFVACVGAG